MKKTLLLRGDDPDAIAEAGRILQSGGLVAIPTETVYGLAANGLDEAAVASLFHAKGRPQDNPLILHIADPDELFRYVSRVPDAAKALSARFWPGPLTVVLPKASVIPNSVTAGLGTVAVRCPAHSAAREIIRAAGVPLAAPSANMSGKPSPTSAEHVLSDLNGRIDAVFDGGPCEIGLESSVVDLSGDTPRLLRPGGVSIGALRGVIGTVEAAPDMPLRPDEAPMSPGMKYRHYAPDSELFLLRGSVSACAGYVAAHAGKYERTAVLCFDGDERAFSVPAIPYGRSERPEELSRRLFAALREADGLGAEALFAVCPEGGHEFDALMNRLKKAAGHRIIDV